MNDYTCIAGLYDLYVTDTRDHSFESPFATETSPFILAVLEPANT